MLKVPLTSCTLTPGNADPDEFDIGQIERVRLKVGEGDRTNSFSITIHDPGLAIASKYRERSLKVGGIAVPSNLLEAAKESSSSTPSAGTSAAIAEGAKGDALAAQILAYARSNGVTDQGWQAALLGTAAIETSMGEFLEEIDDGSNYSYLGSDAAWHGRGIVQLTGVGNYQRAGEKLGKDFIANPDDVSKLENAIPILVLGMRDGWFTGKKLDEYGTGANYDYDGSRNIVNPGEGGGRRSQYVDFCKQWYSKIPSIQEATSGATTAIAGAADSTAFVTSGSTSTVKSTPAIPATFVSSDRVTTKTASVAAVATATPSTAKTVTTNGQSLAIAGLQDAITEPLSIVAGNQNPEDAIVRIIEGSDEATGFIISSDGIVLTNQHVAAAATGKVGFKDGKEVAIEWLANDPSVDLAVGKLKEGAPYPTLSLAQTSELKEGQGVRAIGHPENENWKSTRSVIAALGTECGLSNTKCAKAGVGFLKPGNSGCPIFTSAGVVVGIARAIDPAGNSFFIPIETVHKFLLANKIQIQQQNTIKLSGDAPVEVPKEAVEVSIALGFNYSDKTQTYGFWLTGVSTSTDLPPKTTFTGRGVRYLLEQSDRKRRTLENLSLRQITERVGEAAGVAVEVPSTQVTEKTLDRVIQTGETDAKFLDRIAKAQGLVVSEKDDKITLTDAKGKEVVKVKAEWHARLETEDEAEASRILGELPSISTLADGKAIKEGYRTTLYFGYPDLEMLAIAPGTILEIDEGVIPNLPAPFCRDYRVKAIEWDWRGDLSGRMELYIPVNAKDTSAGSGSAEAGSAGVVVPGKKIETPAELENLTSLRMIEPVPGGTYTSFFGFRTHPVLGGRRIHQGTDIGANEGAQIVAACAGVIIQVGDEGDGYGNKIIQYCGKVAGKMVTILYGHNSVNEVAVGALVQQGEPIAKVGSTGMSTGPHLHFSTLYGWDWQANGYCPNGRPEWIHPEKNFVDNTFTGTVNPLGRTDTGGVATRA